MKPAILHETIERDEFRTPCSPEGVRFMQVTSDTKRDSTVACQYIIRWTPDSKRFLFFRTRPDDGSGRWGIWMCDTEDGFFIRPVYEWDTMIYPHTPYGRDAEGKIAGNH